MKNPKLAAILNVITGLGYVYIDSNRIFGWLLLVGTILGFASLFDPAFIDYANAPIEWQFLVIGGLSCGAYFVAFIVDGYKEAVRHNATLKTKKLKRG